MNEDRRPAVFDQGLQPERTALAWRRTALALIGAAVVAARIMPEALGAWALVPAGFGVIFAIGVLVAAHRRFLVVHRTLTEGDTDHLPLPSGRLPLLVVIIVIAGGLAALAVVLVERLG